MAETVLSMARSMLGGAISMAASAAASEMSLLMGVRKDIWFIKDELKTMQAFLVAAEAMKKKDMLLKVWAEQVRDLSYGIEDCLAEFMEHVGSRSLSQQLMKLKDRHRIAAQIRDLKSRVEEVSSRNTRYNLIKMEDSNSTDEVDSYMEDVRNHSARNIDESELVGFSKPKEELIELMDISTTDDLAKVVCVVGMGGLGKTTVARKTYESKEDIVTKFSCSAWITVSQSFFKIEMLKDMIRQLLGQEPLKECLDELQGKILQVDDLSKYLTKELKDKRYFIILDDLWNIHDWEWIKEFAFPSSNMRGSRIVVTTRDIGLAEKITLEKLIYHLKPLASVDAINLLLRKSSKTQEDMEKDENLKNIVEKLVKKCGGLPLAVLTIGGILATKKIAEWDHVYNQLPFELESNPSLEAMRRVVTLSYSQLPSHLKSCFLYLSIFPEDSEINRTRLVNRWIAEGFVRAKVGMTIEEVGKRYFTELINRSLIQPSRVNIEGSVTSCRVHDIVRDVTVSISRDENFVYLAEDSITSIAEQNFRHVAYQGSSCPKIDMDWSHVRSLTMFGERPMEHSPSVCSVDLRMLRALDLEDAQFIMTQKDIENIGLLRHLKFVNIRSPNRECACIYELPRSIGKLRGLQILDIRDTYITTLPTEISTLQSLRSLRCSTSLEINYCRIRTPTPSLMATLCLALLLVVPDERAWSLLFEGNRQSQPARAWSLAELHMAFSTRLSYSEGVKLPRGIGNLKELLVLEIVNINRTSSKAIEQLGKLMQLRKLGMVTEGATEKKCKILCVAIENLCSLCSFRVDAGWDGTLEWLHSVSALSPLLRSLRLCGRLGEEMPNWVGSLMQLVKITLIGSRLKGGKITEILGTLPSLMLLALIEDACFGEKLVFRTEAFPNLKQLQFFNLKELKEVRFEEGTSPHMESIEIDNCRLESGIIGIKHLPRLKEISLGMGGHVARLGVLQGEVDEHPNKPVLRLEWDWGDRDLGNIVQGSDAVAEEESSLHPEPAVAGESSSQVVSLMPTTTSKREDDYNVEDDDGDDLRSCISDDDEDAS